MKYQESRDIRIFRSKASSLVRILFTAGILLLSLNGYANGQFGQFEEYFSEQMQQYQDVMDEDIQGFEDFQDIQDIQDGFNPFNQYDNTQACHNNEGEQACIASAGTIRVGRFGKCYCDLPDGRSCDFQDLVAGNCGEQPSPEPGPNSECSGTLQGRVADASTGLPIPGAVIVPEVASNGGSLTSTSDDSGYYSISRPEISLCPKKVSFYVKCSADGYQPASNMASTDANGDATCDFQLAPLASPESDSECKGTLKGHVTDASTGQPISGAAIDASCRTVCPATDELGYYSITSPEISICPGTSRKVDCSADGYQPATNYAPTDSEGDITCDFQLVPLSSPAPEPEPELYSFTVNVVDAQNHAVEGAEVTVDERPRGLTGADGSLEVQLADGQHAANASRSGHVPGEWRGTLDHNSNPNITISLQGATFEQKEDSKTTKEWLIGDLAEDGIVDETEMNMINCLIEKGFFAESLRSGTESNYAAGGNAGIFTDLPTSANNCDAISMGGAEYVNKNGVGWLIGDFNGDNRVTNVEAVLTGNLGCAKYLGTEFYNEVYENYVLGGAPDIGVSNWADLDCLQGPGPIRQPAIHITSIVPSEGTTLYQGKDVTFKVNVEYDLGSNDLGRIDMAADAYSFGAPDQSIEIDEGDATTGSRTIEFTEKMSQDWSSCFITVTLHGAKSGQQIPTDSIAADFKVYPVQLIQPAKTGDADGDGTVTREEVEAIILEWKNDTATVAEVVEAINNWVNDSETSGTSRMSSAEVEAQKKVFMKQLGA